MIDLRILACLPPIFFAVSVGLLYIDRWRARRKVSALGEAAPDVQIPGPLGWCTVVLVLDRWTC